MTRTRPGHCDTHKHRSDELRSVSVRNWIVLKARLGRAEDCALQEEFDKIRRLWEAKDRVGQVIPGKLVREVFKNLMYHQGSNV